MAISRMPPAPLNASSRRLAQHLAASSSRANRRDYWSSRCGKAKHSERSPYRYWASYPSLLRSRYEHLRNEAIAAAATAAKTERTKAADSHEPTGSRHNIAHGKIRADNPRESDVQAEELRYYEEFQRLTKEQWRAHIDLLRQAIERDPYAALFGMSERRGLWNPFRSRWLEPDEQQPEPTRDHGKKQNIVIDKIFVKETNVKAEPIRTTRNDNAPSPRAGTHSGTANLVSPGSSNVQTNPSSSSFNEEEVYIDPITLRKVTRPRPLENSAPSQNEATRPVSSTEDSVDIPVKTYKPLSEALARTSKASPEPPKKALAGFASQPWLQREGFSDQVVSRQEPLYAPRPPPKGPSPAPKVIHLGPRASESNEEPARNSNSGRVESSLNRLSEKQTTFASTANNPTKSNLKYEFAENRTEDIDLLRASDIRAAAGKPKQRRLDTPAHEIALRRQALYAKFVESQKKFEQQLKREVITALKHDSSPTKSPLWSLWMLYDHEARKNWAKWSKEQNFTIRGHEEFEQMQFMTKAFISQMPSPSEIFNSGGTSLGRFLDANRASMAIRDFKAFMNTWHMELQTILSRRGARPFSEDVLDDIRRSLLRYNRELRQQILDGYDGLKPIPRHVSPATKKLFEQKPTVEMAKYRDAMKQFEERSKNTPTRGLQGKKDWTIWSQSNLKRSTADQDRLRQDRELFTAVKGVYEENKAAFHQTTNALQASSPSADVTEFVKTSQEVSSATERDRQANLQREPMSKAIESQLPSHGKAALDASPKEIPLATGKAAEPIAARAMDTIVLKISYEDEDVKVHRLVAAEVDSELSGVRTLNTSGTEGSQKVLDFMRRASPRTLSSIMRLDTTLNSSSYLLVNYTSDMLVYQKLAPEGSQPTAHSDYMAELLTQPWPNLTGAPETVEALVNARTGRSIEMFELAASQPRESMSTPHAGPAAPIEPKSPLHAEASSQIKSSTTPGAPFPDSKAKSDPSLFESNSNHPNQFTIPAEEAAELSQPVRRTEPLFSGQSVRTHRRRMRHQHRRGHFGAPRWTRRLARALGRAVYTVGLFLLGAYMIGLGIEWGRVRDSQRRAAEAAEEHRLGQRDAPGVKQ